jgi:hypothetical protein
MTDLGPVWIVPHLALPKYWHDQTQGITKNWQVVAVWIVALSTCQNFGKTVGFYLVSSQMTNQTFGTLLWLLFGLVPDLIICITTNKKTCIYKYIYMKMGLTHTCDIHNDRVQYIK